MKRIAIIIVAFAAIAWLVMLGSTILTSYLSLKKHPEPNQSTPAPAREGAR